MCTPALGEQKKKNKGYVGFYWLPCWLCLWHFFVYVSIKMSQTLSILKLTMLVVKCKNKPSRKLQPCMGQRLEGGFRSFKWRCSFSISGTQKAAFWWCLHLSCLPPGSQQQICRLLYLIYPTSRDLKMSQQQQYPRFLCQCQFGKFILQLGKHPKSQDQE